MYICDSDFSLFFRNHYIFFSSIILIMQNTVYLSLQLIAVYDEISPKISITKDNNQDDTNNNTPSHQQVTKQYDDTIITSAALSDNDSGVAADSYGLSSNNASTHTSLNSSSKPPRGIQRRYQQTKQNESFRSSLSSNSPTSSPEASKRALNPAFSRDLNRKSLSTNHPMLYRWIDQHEKYNQPGYLPSVSIQICSGFELTMRNHCDRDLFEHSFRL